MEAFKPGLQVDTAQQDAQHQTISVTPPTCFAKLIVPSKPGLEMDVAQHDAQHQKVQNNESG